jgi:hypothetical protein
MIRRRAGAGHASVASTGPSAPRVAGSVRPARRRPPIRPSSEEVRRSSGRGNVHIGERVRRHRQSASLRRLDRAGLGAGSNDGDRPVRWGRIDEQRGGNVSGGGTLERGTLHHLLQNRLYRGEIDHEGTVCPGEHEAIVDRDLWDRVQVVLAENRVDRAVRSDADRRASSPVSSMTKTASR